VVQPPSGRKPSLLLHGPPLLLLQSGLLLLHGPPLLLLQSGLLWRTRRASRECALPTSSPSSEIRPIGGQINRCAQLGSTKQCSTERCKRTVFMPTSVGSTKRCSPMRCRPVDPWSRCCCFCNYTILLSDYVCCSCCSCSCSYCCSRSCTCSCSCSDRPMSGSDANNVSIICFPPTKLPAPSLLSPQGSCTTHTLRKRQTSCTRRWSLFCPLQRKGSEDDHASAESYTKTFLSDCNISLTSARVDLHRCTWVCRTPTMPTGVRAPRGAAPCGASASVRYS